MEFGDGELVVVTTGTNVIAAVAGTAAEVEGAFALVCDVTMRVVIGTVGIVVVSNALLIDTLPDTAADDDNVKLVAIADVNCCCVAVNGDIVDDGVEIAAVIMEDVTVCAATAADETLD